MRFYTMEKRENHQSKLRYTTYEVNLGQDNRNYLSWKRDMSEKQYGPLIYKHLANAVFWFHIIWAVLLLSSSVLTLYFLWMRVISLTVITTTLFSQILWKGCPLIYLEGVFREQYDPEHKSAGTFIPMLLRKYFGIQVPALAIFLKLVVLFIIVLLVNIFQQRT